MASTVKMIVPKPLNTTGIHNALYKKITRYENFVLNDFQKTVAHWKKVKLNFKARTYVLPHSMGIYVEMEGDEKSVQIWNWLDEGTKDHDIPKSSGGKVLRFKWGGPGSYKAGSRPNTVNTGSASSTGKMVSFKKVHHPGTKSRNWRDTVAKLHKKTFKAWMQVGMADAAKASGHDMP